VHAIAQEKGCTPSQLALAWVMAQGRDIVPIPGTKRRAFLEDNVGAASIALSAADIHRIEEAMPRGAIVGTRYPEAAMRALNG
jgi:aryl-alcohol dehydrogenase-like predicted oxidoreductase